MSAQRRRVKDKPAGSIPRLEAMNIIGLSQLMNPLNIDSSKSGEEAEKQITGRSGQAGVAVPAPEAKTILQDLEVELRELKRDLGVSSDEEEEAPAEDAAATSSFMAPDDSPPIAPPPPARETDEPVEAGGSLDFSVGPGLFSAPAKETAGESDDSDDSDDESDDSSDADSESSGDSDGGGAASSSTHEASAILKDLEKEWGIDLSEKSFERARVVNAPVVAQGPSYEAHWAHRKGEGDEHRRHIDKVMRNLRDETRTTYGAQNDREQDDKASKLEQIAQLRDALQDEGMDCKEIGNPTMNSSNEEIDAVLRTLRVKNDRNRCATLAEEVILSGAEAIEYVLDGEQEIPWLGWKPDYRGYHHTVGVKLHRMRFETATVVNEIIRDYNLSPSSRILMELLPSFLLYPRQQQRQRANPGLSQDPDFMRPRVEDARSAYAAIRSRDEIGTTMGKKASKVDQFGRPINEDFSDIIGV